MAIKPYVKFVGFYDATERLAVFHGAMERFVAIYIDVEAYRQIFMNVGIEAAEVFVLQAMNKVQMGSSRVQDVIRITENQILVLLGLSEWQETAFLTNIVESVITPFVYHGFLPVHAHAVIEGPEFNGVDLLTKLYKEVAPFSGKANFDSKFDIERAIVNGEITSFFQPVLRTNGDLRGFECLARWVVEDEILPPDKFLGELNRKGFGKSLIINHLYRSDKLLNDIKEKFGTVENLVISINIEPKLLSDNRFVDELVSLRLCNDRSHFEFEMVESGNLELVHGHARATKILKEKGFKFAIDDFGVGYAISNTLTSDIGTVKIDRKLVNSACNGDTLSQNIIKGLVATFHSVTRQTGEVIAEGIESSVMKDIVSALGVDALQGYLFAKPMGFADLLDWLDHGFGYKKRKYNNVVSFHENKQS